MNRERRAGSGPQFAQDRSRSTPPSVPPPAPTHQASPERQAQAPSSSQSHAWIFQIAPISPYKTPSNWTHSNRDYLTYEKEERKVKKSGRPILRSLVTKSGLFALRAN